MAQPMQPSYYQQPQQPVQYQSVQYVQQPVSFPATNTMQMATQYAQPLSQPQPPQQPAPVPYGAQLRGVGIKFGWVLQARLARLCRVFVARKQAPYGSFACVAVLMQGARCRERIDPRSGGFLVYVKHLVKGGPADQSGRIQPGDVLQLINGEDIYGQGLDILREKIPGPAGSNVKLGFRSYAGALYEVDLARTAYGDQPPDAPEQQVYAPQQMQPVAAPQSRVMMVPAAVRVRSLHPPRRPSLFPAECACRIF
jgi:hypothetical protein